MAVKQKQLVKKYVSV